jgi:hypothetical protein
MAASGWPSTATIAPVFIPSFCATVLIEASPSGIVVPRIYWFERKAGAH